MTDIRLDPNLQDKLHNMPEIRTITEDAATQVAQIARSMAPVLTGAYQRGILTQQTKDGARVLATDEKSAWIEFGIPSRGIPARWILS